jgi:hypothetical protein
MAANVAEASVPSEHEVLAISALTTPGRRRRFKELFGNRAKRNKLINEFLADVGSFDARYVSPIPSHQQNAIDIERLLTARGAPSSCHVMSEDRRLDGRDMPLAAALAEIVGWGAPSLVSSLPGRLAYFEGDEPNERYLLQRKVAASRA